jgi:hypothetical protein
MMKSAFKTRGAAMLLFVMFFTFATSALMFVLGQSIFSDLNNFNRTLDAKRALLVSDSMIEDVVMRYVFGTYELDETESLTLGGVTANSVRTYDSPSDIVSINATSSVGTVVRKSYAELTIGSGDSFNYGLQAGNGGISLENGSAVVGNIYSNGTVVGSGNAEARGDLVSAGPSGYISGITATGSIYANTIEDIEAGEDAYYNVALGSNTIGGTAYTPVANQPTTTFPISTSTIQEWKDAILDHGTTITAADPLCSSGTYTIDSSVTIGYLKVECDLDIEETGGDIYITMDGPVWVEGNLSFTQGPTIQVDSDLGRRSTQFIVDNPANSTTSSQIEIRNSTDFNGSGDDRSYIMLLSMNNSAEQGGGEIAIDISQSANGKMLAYAGYGTIHRI